MNFFLWKNKINKVVVETNNIKDNNAALELIKKSDKAGKKANEENKNL